MFKVEIVGESLYDLRQKINRVQEELNEREGYVAAQPVLPFISLSAPEQTIECPVIVPSLPPLTTFPITNTVTAGELDIKGMPHDLRIHSEKKSKNLDGSWRYKRGVGDADINAVEAQLRGGVVSQTHAVLPSFPPPPAVTTAPTFVAPIAPPQAVIAPIVVVPVEPVIIPAAPQIGVKPAHSLHTFKNNLTELLAQFINEGKINQDYVASLCDYFKIKDIWNVLASERQCVELFDVFVKAGFVTRIEG